MASPGTYSASAMASPGTYSSSFAATNPPKAFKIMKVILAFKFKSTTYLLLSMQGQGDLTSMLQGQFSCISPDVKMITAIDSTLSFLDLPSSLEMRSSVHESGNSGFLEIPPVLLSCLPLLRSNAQLPAGIMIRESSRPTATACEEKNLSSLLQKLISSNLPFHLLLSESDLAFQEPRDLPSILDILTVAGGAFSFSTTTFLLSSALFQHPVANNGINETAGGAPRANNSASSDGVVLQQQLGRRRRRRGQGQRPMPGAGGGDDEGGDRQGNGNDYRNPAFILWLLFVMVFLVIVLIRLFFAAWSLWQWLQRIGMF